MDMNALRKELEDEEKFVRHAYRDSLGYLTIGIGRLVDKEKGGGISYEEGMYLLNNDIAGKVADLDRLAPWWSDLSEVRQRAIINMAFQMGVAGVLKFKVMVAALQAGNFDSAADAALDSKWAREDSPNRANRIAGMIRRG